MTEKEYKEHIQYTHNAYCRIVIRHASILDNCNSNLFRIQFIIK